MCGSCLCPPCCKGGNPRSLGALELDIRKKVTEPGPLSPEEGAGRRETLWLMNNGPAGRGDGGGVLGTHTPPSPRFPQAGPLRPTRHSPGPCRGLVALAALVAGPPLNQIRCVFKQIDDPFH